jgi:uncharacterized protein YgbK (DUF1537 family)
VSLLIIADDLSGAADCAIAFASAGLRTVVTLDPGHDTGQADVIALDTDTRRLSPAEAARRSVAAGRALMTDGQRLYKKIDSTLRGNWAAEVAGLQALAGLAIVAPAFPATGRTTLDGRVWVNGQALESTDTWQLEHAGQCADLDGMLQAVGLRTARLSLALVRGDAAALAEYIGHCARGDCQALIVDAETGDDLRRLARATLPLGDALFWVGSGGLAREIAGLIAPLASPAQPIDLPTEPQGPILVLVGSLSAVSERQCALLGERAGLHPLTVAPDILREGPRHPAWAHWQQRVGDCLARGDDLLLRMGRDQTFDPAEGAQLSTALAALVHPHFHQVGGLIATGGETARAMLVAVGIGSLRLQCEIEAGVAFGSPVASRDGHRPGIITKAGAFGSEHALYAAWRHLRGAGETAASRDDSNHFPLRQGKHS